MRRANLVPASLLHVGPIAANMREIDKRECGALGRAPKQALRTSLRTSLYALTALSPEGTPLAMFGVCSTGFLSGQGSPWFLGRDEVFDYGRDLMARGPKIIAWWHDTFEVMENIVSTENLKAIALLKRWGATVGGEVQTVRGIDFIPFRFTAAIQGGDASE